MVPMVQVIRLVRLVKWSVGQLVRWSEQKFQKSNIFWRVLGIKTSEPSRGP